MDRAARLISIDALRGMAILAVLAIHIPHDAPGGWRENPFFFPSWLSEFGYLGVPLFIVVSGFCIHRRAAQARQISGSYAFSWSAFWVRRFIRLYPPYLVAIGVSIGAAFFLHDRVEDPASMLGWDLVTHLLLIHNLTWEYATGLGNGAFWSLGTEEQLYALYFVMLLLLTRRGVWHAVAVAGAVTVCWRLLVPHLGQSGLDVGPFTLGKWYQWPLHYWLHWVLGALAVNAWYGNTRLPSWCYSLPLAAVLTVVGMVFNNATFELIAQARWSVPLLPVAGTVAAQTAHGLGELVILVGFFCLINGLLARERTGIRPSAPARALSSVGKISYSIYLVHIPVIFVLDEHSRLGGSPDEWLARFALYVVVATSAGWVFFQAVERWFIDGRWPSMRGGGSVRVAAGSSGS